MKPINEIPIEVDFNNSEEDGAVRLHLPCSVESFKKLNIEPKEGLNILVSDGEVTGVGNVTLRDGIWVAKITHKSSSQNDE